MNENATYEPLTVQAADLEGRDMWHGTHEIATASAKDKFTHIVFVDGTKKRVANEEAVQVFRETEASRDARYAVARRARLNDKIQGWYDRYEVRRHTNRAHAKVNEILAHEGALVDDYALGGFIEAQAADKVEGRVSRVIELYLGGTAQGDLANAADLVAAVEFVVNDLRDVALGVRGLSRSTSVVANVMEDADRAAAADFVRRWDRTWF